MNNLYFKGLSTDNQELEKIRSMYKEANLKFTNVFYSYASLPILSKDKLNDALDDEFRRCNPIGQDVNIVCHSMGCNLGILEAEKSSKIKKNGLNFTRNWRIHKRRKKNILNMTKCINQIITKKFQVQN